MFIRDENKYKCNTRKEHYIPVTNRSGDFWLSVSAASHSPLGVYLEDQGEALPVGANLL